MRMKRFAIVCLVIVAMTAGFIARSQVDRNDPFAKIQREEALSRSLSASAPSTSPTDVTPRSDVDLRPLQVFYQVLFRLREEYVEPIQKSRERDMTYGALNAMLDSLHDPLTRFFAVDQTKIVVEAQSGKFYGTGAVMSVRQDKQGEITEEKLVVTSTLPGSPAEKAGLLSGDVITRIDGKAVLPYDPFQRVEKYVKLIKNGKMTDQEFRKQLEIENDRLKDGIGFHKVIDMLSSNGVKEYVLTVARPKVASPVKIKVALGETVVDPVTERLINHSVGYIDLNLIIKPAESEFNNAIAGFKKQGVKKIVIDLRDSPGGSLESAQAIAGNLIPKKPLSILQLLKGKRRTLSANAAPAGGQWTGQTVVLVNSGTTGLSEVLAAAVHDGAGAKLVGSKTFGSNFQQTFLKLADGSAVSMTTGKYLTPRGVDFRNKGLAADVTVSGSAKPGMDPTLDKGIEVLTAGKVKG
ncbi:MAG: S41 family peptidase [Armatimonadota bacterium]